MTDEMDRRIGRAWWRRWLGPAGAVAAVTILAAGAWVFLGSAKRSTRVPLASVTIESVHAGVFHDITTLQGKAVPKDTIYLDALEGGQVQKLLVQAGDRVAAGQPLIGFGNTKLE